MGSDCALLREHIGEGIPQQLPEYPHFSEDVDRAPVRKQILTSEEKKLALSNALRYFPEDLHRELAIEFATELSEFGRIYMHRFRPTEYEMRSHPIEEYPANSKQAAAIMAMIQNNLDHKVAQFPYELITYGGNGSVFQNWAQYRLTMQYLSKMSDQQTLVMYSGHPMGLFPSSPEAPRVVVTNGMVIPNYSSHDDYERMNALGVSQYGQMTAGSYMYIGPQGIVHGTTITLMNAARRSNSDLQDLSGVTFVTSGLGGMSGAQAKAATISGAACIIAEINPHAARKRHQQGWITTLTSDVDDAIDQMLKAQTEGKGISIGFIGNIVTLWERLVSRGVNIDLGSDQTSLHNPWQGGYYPADLSFEEAQESMSNEPELFKQKVQESLCRQAKAINSMVSKGMYFWDYGNAFLLEASRAGADVIDENGSFKHPSYVEDIMGPMCFDLGFGPFRWVCASQNPQDLAKTDEIARSILQEMLSSADSLTSQQLSDNLHWITEAGSNDLVVGSQARILYADDQARRNIAQAFNDAISRGEIGPIILGRDHHDVSGTDSPYRETANINDGSSFTADMAVHNFVGDSFRGATWVSLHNGGGVGWGEVINGGFGLLLDGSIDATRKLQSMLHWDVNNGIARRAWARNSNAEKAILRAMHSEPLLEITMPSHASGNLISEVLEDLD